MMSPFGNAQKAVGGFDFEGRGWSCRDDRMNLKEGTGKKNGFAG
jgi:hypothetical protein